MLHTHPPYSVALSASAKPLRAYSQPGALFHNATGHYDDTIRLIRDAEMGAGVARALGSHRAVLLQNHGAVTAGTTIAEAVIGMIMLENAAMVQMIAEAAGETRPLLPDADIEKLKSEIGQIEQFEINFDYLVRRAQRRSQ